MESGAWQFPATRPLTKLKWEDQGTFFMGANDPTKPNQALNGPEDQPADFTKVDIDDLFDRLLTAKEKPTKTSKASAAEPIAIAGYGRIERMTMPEGWKEVEGEDRSLWQFSVEGRPEVAICLPAGFRPLSEEVAERVSAVLSKPAHVLTPTELKSLNELLMERGEPQKFKMVVARTVELNARKVIVVEGRFAE